ncbi:hypothetical protein [Sphingomonas sp. 10B4]|uniref:hypothetical protein n=1 Tax=Sphingomonas sp. 10B4 TaxID=3048575 RepID=UPI002AB5CC23|nr:hypothetical protein [Sphingomonas sp. 10B4]MDY7525466.1 hypothetical protein [Sphingomonas sp. 10B4]MEB0281410.1 hypothetical protein [Sphingomonas sp. 10B4]
MTLPIDFGETGMSYADAAMRPCSKGVPQTQLTAQLDVEALVGRLLLYGARPADESSRGFIGTYISLCNQAAAALSSVGVPDEVIREAYKVGYNDGADEDYNPDACAALAALAHITGEDARVSAAVAGAADRFEAAISEGYPAPANKVGQCEHGQFGWEDCIACYDEALLAACFAIRETPSAE